MLCSNKESCLRRIILRRYVFDILYLILKLLFVFSPNFKLKINSVIPEIFPKKNASLPLHVKRHCLLLILT